MSELYNETKFNGLGLQIIEISSIFYVYPHYKNAKNEYLGYFNRTQCKTQTLSVAENRV